MSTVPHEAATTTGEPLPNLLFDYPGADIILRSQDSYHCRVPKIYILNSSPILGELIRRALGFPGVTNAEALLPVVQQPERGEILHCLLTFIFPVTQLIPSTPDGTMELLSVAQTYQMGFVLTNLRDRIARHHPLPTGLEPALHIYSLAQTYGLRPEALQAARTTLNYSMNLEDFDNIRVLSSAFIYELWKYHERARAILASDLTEFKMSYANGTITRLNCTELGSSQVPSWLDQYITSLEMAPNLFDLAEFNATMLRHVGIEDEDEDEDGDEDRYCKCAETPSQTICDFWEALTSVVHGSFEKVNVVLIICGAAYNVKLFYRQSQLYLSSGIKRTPKSKSIRPRHHLKPLMRPTPIL